VVNVNFIPVLHVNTHSVLYVFGQNEIVVSTSKQRVQIPMLRNVMKSKKLHMIFFHVYIIFKIVRHYFVFIFSSINEVMSNDA